MPLDEPRRRGPKSRAAFARTKLWPVGSTLRIRFLGGTDVQRQRVREVAVLWTRYANLDFQFLEDADAGPSDMRVAFQEGQGSWSYVGTDCRSIPQSAPTMNLGWSERGTILHEFGHAIGLQHEHQQVAGGIEWNREVVMASLSGPPNYWSAEQIESNVLRKLNPTDIVGSDFDLESIMLYDYPKEWTLNGIETKRHQYLSVQDRAWAHRVYPGREYPNPDTEGPAEAAEAGCKCLTGLLCTLFRSDVSGASGTNKS